MSNKFEKKLGEEIYYVLKNIVTWFLISLVIFICCSFKTDFLTIAGLVVSVDIVISSLIFFSKEFDKWYERNDYTSYIKSCKHKRNDDDVWFRGFNLDKDEFFYMRKSKIAYPYFSVRRYL